MYDELAERLRYCSEEQNGCGMCALSSDCVLRVGLLTQAADAIEKLIEIIQNHDFLESLIKPCWISVMERLPENNQIVVAHEGKGTWDFGMFRGISASGNPEYWHWKKNTFKHVKWWMPKAGALPEPPKEEKK